MPHISCAIVTLCMTGLATATHAAIVPISQLRTASAGGVASAPDFAAWNGSRSSNVTSTNPSTPGLIVGSVVASQASPAITSTSMASNMGASFSALRVGSGGAAQTRFEVVFDVVDAPVDVRLNYTSVFNGTPFFSRTTRVTLAGPVTYTRDGFSNPHTTNLSLTPGRYTLTGLAELGPATYDSAIDVSLSFSLTAIPTPATAAIFLGLASTGLMKRRRR